MGGRGVVIRREHSKCYSVTLHPSLVAIQPQCLQLEAKEACYFLHDRIVNNRAREMAQWIRELVVHEENPGFVPTINTMAYNSVSLFPWDTTFSSDHREHQACTWYAYIYVS